MKPCPNLLLIFLALVAGNFFYQWAADMNWIVAVERSFFQGVALLAVAVCSRGLAQDPKGKA